ncbi:hypothetical protein SAMN04488238_1532 [Roseicitreum antarcticum]|uniref:Uncharacterized protein n=1 Tax=Roseicitreum antarcticum TaxID=564137 RepID=A0A1H3FX97_9RHOB|nr:hypothetical protein SAMN04488238_1532 [Roseicitreum antarcticum]
MPDPAKTRHRIADMPPAQQAGILCNDARFQRFAAACCKAPGHQFSASAAAQYLRMHCDVKSRRELNTDPKAARKLANLRTAFDAWAGKLASPRP